MSVEFDNTPVEQLCLIFSGKIMKDHETLGTHNITDGMTVHLVIRSGNNSANNQQQNNQGQQQTPPVGNPGQTPFGLGGIGGLPGMSNIGKLMNKTKRCKGQIEQCPRRNHRVNCIPNLLHTI